MSPYFEKRCMTLAGVRYVWYGGYGSVVRSYERGVRHGDVRVIGDDMLYAYMVYPRFLRSSEVCWTFLEPTNERISEFRRKLFGVES